MRRRGDIDFFNINLGGQQKGECRKCFLFFFLSFRRSVLMTFLYAKRELLWVGSCRVFQNYRSVYIRAKKYFFLIKQNFIISSLFSNNFTINIKKKYLTMSH